MPASPISSTVSTTRSVIRRASNPNGSRAVHVTVLFSPGRPEALRRQVARRLLDILRSDSVMGGADVATSVEIRQFEPGMYITERDI